MAFRRAASPRHRDGEKAGQPQTGHDDHHAEQQRDRVEVDRLVGVFQRQRTGGDHQAGTHQRHTGPIDAESRYLADGERQIACGEDDGRRDFLDIVIDPGLAVASLVSLRRSERW